jgi:hypothetical protein
VVDHHAVAGQQLGDSGLAVGARLWTCTRSDLLDQIRLGRPGGRRTAGLAGGPVVISGGPDSTYPAEVLERESVTETADAALFGLGYLDSEPLRASQGPLDSIAASPVAQARLAHPQLASDLGDRLARRSQTTRRLNSGENRGGRRPIRTLFHRKQLVVGGPPNGRMPMGPKFRPRMQPPFAGSQWDHLGASCSAAAGVIAVGVRLLWWMSVNGVKASENLSGFDGS